MWSKPCSECGKQLRVTAKSLPRPRCHDCRRLARESADRASRPLSIPPSKRAQCAGCGVDVWRSSTSAAVQYCMSCRRKHGTAARYKAGCRCSECKAYNNARARRLRKVRAEAGKPITRPTVRRSCETCNLEFDARLDRVRLGKGRFCSVRCMDITVNGVDTSDVGWSRRARFRLSPVVRLSVYERDRWICQLCMEPVDVGADPNSDLYPSVDHVVPRALGGSDEFENLQCAHRVCNSKKGARYGDSGGDVAVAA